MFPFCTAGRVRSLSTALWSLTHLTALHLSDNSLSRIPPDIAKLHNLVYLDLSSNKIRSLPAELGNMVSLRWVTSGVASSPSFENKWNTDYVWFSDVRVAKDLPCVRRSVSGFPGFSRSVGICQIHFKRPPLYRTWVGEHAADISQWLHWSLSCVFWNVIKMVVSSTGSCF